MADEPILELEPLETCARLTVLQHLLRGIYADALGAMPPEMQEQFRKSCVDRLRYSMTFQHDDGEVSVRMQAMAVELAEAFFDRIMGTSRAKEISPAAAPPPAGGMN